MSRIAWKIYSPQARVAQVSPCNFDRKPVFETRNFLTRSRAHPLPSYNLRIDRIPRMASTVSPKLSPRHVGSCKRHKPNTSSSPANYYLLREHNSITLIFHPSRTRGWGRRGWDGAVSGRDGRVQKATARSEGRKVHSWRANSCKTCDAERPYYDKSRLSNALAFVRPVVFDLQSSHIARNPT